MKSSLLLKVSIGGFLALVVIALGVIADVITIVDIPHRWGLFQGAAEQSRVFAPPTNTALPQGNDLAYDNTYAHGNTHANPSFESDASCRGIGEGLL